MLDAADLDRLFQDPPDQWGEPPPSDALIGAVEAELGHRLPAAYLAMARLRNGGLLRRDRFPTSQSNPWADDHVAVTGISAVGRTATFSLCGPLGSPFMQEEWEYPAFGVVFAGTPTGGHQMLMLDYRGCGVDDEPRVVHVDEEDDHRVIVLAPDFTAFVRGLVEESALRPRG